MSVLDELIHTLCPEGVEFVKIKDISEVGTGNSNKNEAVENGLYPFFVRSKNVETMNSFEFDEEAIIIPGEGGIGEIFHYINGKYALHQRVYRIHFVTNRVNTKFVYYYMATKFKKFILKKAVSSTVTSIRKPMIEEFKIPIPPLKVQDEIVRILDKFTSLKEELKKELNARKKQYDYYKQKVFEKIKTDNIKHITDIALVKARVGWQRLTRAEYLQNGDYYLITGTDFTSDGKIDFNSCVFVTKDRYEMDQNIQVHKDDVLITKDGTLGKVAILNEEPNKLATLNSGVFRIKVLDEKEVYPKYLYHFFTSKYFKDFVESVKTGSTIPHLTQQGLVTLDIPIPSFEEQIEIVKLLDKFEVYCNDLIQGLPAEIQARQKQYEYYRDKLLTFKENED